MTMTLGHAVKFRFNMKHAFTEHAEIFIVKYSNYNKVIFMGEASNSTTNILMREGTSQMPRSCFFENLEYPL